MIKKILLIKNVGRFQNFCGRNDKLSLSKNTFIYGKNTHGKSTLAAICRSLALEKSDLVIGRRSFGSSGEQNVIIKTENEEVKFRNGRWDKKLDIQIFDNKYISENIYTDDYIDEKKQQKIASIILGQEGKRFENEYNKAKEKKEENTREKTGLTQLYNKNFDSRLCTFEQFRQINENPNIEKEITDLNNKIKAANNQKSIDVIVTEILKYLDKINILNVSVLTGSLSIEQDKIEDHILNNFKMQEGSLAFLDEGMKFLKDKIDGGFRNCVFCGQKLLPDAEELMKNYKILFSESYNKFVNDINHNIDFLRNWEVENLLLSRQVQLQNLNVNVDFKGLIESITNNRKSLIIEIEKKQKNLNYEINFRYLELLKDSINEIKNDIINPIHLTYQKAFEPSRMEALLERKKLLEITKRRYEKQWVVNCNEYNRLEEDFETKLKPAEEKAFKARKEYAENVFINYGQIINSILEKLGANFILDDFKGPQHRRDRYRLFRLKFLPNYRVEIDGKENQINFKNTLSDSDRRLLAFAFFVAEIKIQDNIKKTVVLLDDPMSSFDKERKINTIKTIRDDLTDSNGNKPNQLIILTHEENFLKFLNKLISKDTKFFRIIFDATDGGSRIVCCNMKEEFLKEPYFKMLEELKDFADEKSNRVNLSNIRKLIEHIVDRKYYFGIPQQTRKSGGIISWYLERIDNGLKRELNDLLPHVPHHDQSYDIDEEDLEDEEKRYIVKSFLKILCRL